jgi:hypothetical protein
VVYNSSSSSSGSEYLHALAATALAGTKRARPSAFIRRHDTPALLAPLGHGDLKGSVGRAAEAQAAGGLLHSVHYIICFIFIGGYEKLRVGVALYMCIHDK